ncbi:MAG: PD-(D/E)XK nuclease family protein, partial [Planctomycetota bacterium]|nr:PD-(D/E)XK nuclease family protein [Planctomycetota bacterium]
DPLAYTPAELPRVRAAFEAQTREVSVSRLNQGVACPHRFFLAYVARVPQDDATLEGPVYDNRARGKALHTAFELALREPTRSAASVAEAAAADAGAQGLEALLLRHELLRVVDLLRDREKGTQGPLRPWSAGFEYAFGGETAVELGPPDARFRLGGFIDRIDRGTWPGLEGELAVIADYKRSVTAADMAAGAAKDGRDLQLPLYARAIEARLGTRVVGLEWLAGLARMRRGLHDAAAEDILAHRRENKALWSEPSEAFRARLDVAEATAADVIRRARAADHRLAPAARGTCADCPWRAVCRPDIRALEASLAQAEAAGGDA